MDFSQLQLDTLLQKALTACQYVTPTPIQAKAIPSILEGRDVAASAETGSGKTAAFVLPALHHLQQQGPAKNTRILILTPTRELAAQIAKAAHQYGKFMRFKIVCLVGGLPYHQQIRDLSRGADIIVATPGRLLDHVRSQRVDLSKIDMLVLDEADRMLDMGFIEDIETVVGMTPSSRQTLLFSATLDKKINHVVKTLLKNPVHIDLSKQSVACPNINQMMYKVKNIQQKSSLLRQFLNDENIYKAIIFSATKISADRLAQELCDDGFLAASLHGDLRQRVRDRTVDQLRSGKIQFLVATDVAARGIDIHDITHVINFDLPRDGEDYVHRIGRTGRAGKHGTAISFVSSADFRLLQRIEKYIGKRFSFAQVNQPLLSHESTRIRQQDDVRTSNRQTETFHKEKHDTERSRKYHDRDRDRNRDGSRDGSRDRDREFRTWKHPSEARKTKQSSGPKNRFSNDDSDGGQRKKRPFKDRTAEKPRSSRFAKDAPSGSGEYEGRKSRYGFSEKPATRGSQKPANKMGKEHTSRTESARKKDNKPSSSFGRDSFQRVGAPKTTTWRKKDKTG